MNIFSFFRSFWHRDAVSKATNAARTIVTGLSTDQFNWVVDEVVRTSRMDKPGLEKARHVTALISDPKLVTAYRFPPWVVEGIDFASTVVHLAWVVAKILKRIK